MATTHTESLTDSFGDTFPDEHFIRSVYDTERCPFDHDQLHPGVSVSPVSHLTTVQTFLSRNGLNITEEKPLTHEAFRVHLSRLLAVMDAELARLERNTWGVHHAIVVCMQEWPPVEAARNLLVEVLIPEWRQHLDDFVYRNNALIWFDMCMRHGTQFEMELDQYISDRKKRIHQMVTFVVQRLQIAKEEVDSRHSGTYSESESSDRFSAMSPTLTSGCDSYVFPDSECDSDNESLFTFSPSSDSDMDDSATNDSSRAGQSGINIGAMASINIDANVDVDNHQGPLFIFPKL